MSGTSNEMTTPSFATIVLQSYEKSDIFWTIKNELSSAIVKRGQSSCVRSSGRFDGLRKKKRLNATGGERVCLNLAENIALRDHESGQLCAILTDQKNLSWQNQFRN
jgi:hypothetical protein